MDYIKEKGLKGGMECSACHGDNAGHLSGKGKMVDLVTADPEKITEICGACHLQPKQGLISAPRLSLMAWNAGSHMKKGMSCTSCHRIHARKEESITRLCLRCHQPGEALGDLKGKPGEHVHDFTGDCTTCHRPHGEIRGVEEFTRKNVHKPVAERKCNSCHTPHLAAGGKLTLGEANAVCIKCHEDKLQFYLFTPHGQAAVRAGQSQCLNCHEVHSSNYPGLLRHEPYRICQACHSDRTPHHFLVDADVEDKKLPCGSCHNPHGSETQYYLKMDEKNICLECHKK
jgi:predicted CXXCH cytochrome family protein